MILYDTANMSSWRGVLVRCPGDTNQHTADGFLNVERGDVIQMTGVVQEFQPPGDGSNTVTQLAPIQGIAISVIGSAPIPEPPTLDPIVFYEGTPFTGKIWYSTGEQYEGMNVQMVNLVKDANINIVNGTFRLKNPLTGNAASDYDMSKWFTLRTTFKDPLSTFVLPPNGTTIDTIRGIITTSTGGENMRGYRICPTWPPGDVLYPNGDLVLGSALPNLTFHRRNPVVVTPDSTPVVSCRLTPGSFAVTSIDLKYSVDFGPYTTVGMALDTLDTLYKATIPAQLAGKVVNYFIRAQDANGSSVYLANAHPQLFSDTSQGKFFYTVTPGQVTIKDVQYCPYLHGYSGLVGATVTVDGIVTADTAHLNKTSINASTFGTFSWYIQSSNQPWSGVWIQAPESLMHGIVNGDSIRVTGTIGEWLTSSSNVTNIYNISSVVKLASGLPVPEPVNLAVANFTAQPNGSPLAEPYEGMLVRFTNLTVSHVAPYFADPTEYEITDGISNLRVRRDGVNDYSNQPGDTTSGKVVFTVGEKIDTLVGIMYFSANVWKITPRTNDDILFGHPVVVNNRWNVVSVSRKLVNYAKVNVFPTATSAAFAYEGGYQQKDTLVNGAGYWVKFGSAQTLHYEGVTILEDSIDVVPGWNMIGSITSDIATSSIVQVPADNVKSPFYVYNNGYATSSTISGGKGYWVKVDSAGMLILAGTFAFKGRDAEVSALAAFNELTITDRNGNNQTLFFGPSADMRGSDFYAMPPMPPAGAFDARFVSQRMAEVYPENLSGEQTYMINLRDAAYPLTATWTIRDKDMTRAFFLNGTIAMEKSGSTIIKGLKENGLAVKVVSGSIPAEFALGQNYPNPFNPTTRMKIAVPQTAAVEVVVYDILGRKVRTLINEERSAGYHMVEWNGLNDQDMPVGTGVYFVRMVSEKFNAVHKIMLMK
jgi:hypothetical protein